MKKFVSMLLSAMLLISLLLPGEALAADKKISVVTTIFPIYDWVRQVAGEENIELTMLLDSGADLHNYQPSAPDILKISTCDLFIFVGGESDDWTDDVLAHSMNPDMVVMNLLDALGDDVKEEETVEGMEDHEEHHEDEEHEADEHIWLSLRNAEKLVKNIADALKAIDPDGAEVYEANAEAYIEKLANLDAQYAEVTDSAVRKTILFGDRFPFRYLADDYGLTYYAAFSGCSAETEASFQTIVFLANKVDELQLPVVMTIENPKTRIAETIVQSTSAKNQQILSMDSMQGVTAEKLRQGVDYLEIMTENLKVLQEALN